MGHTHYVENRMTPIPQEKWNKFRTDFRRLYDEQFTELIQREDDDKREPVISANEIRFNGIGDKGHETFVLHRDQFTDFDFCKTDYKPYDLAVTACLILAAHYFASRFTLRSDGKRIDWRPAKRLLQKTFPGTKFNVWRRNIKK